MPHIAIDYDKEKLRDFCRKWKITEFSLFGSVVRDDFGPESDVDVLLTLATGAPWSLAKWLLMQKELEHLFQRRVDLVERSAVEQSLNRFRKRAILSTAVMLDVACPRLSRGYASACKRRGPHRTAARSRTVSRRSPHAARRDPVSDGDRRSSESRIVRHAPQIEWGQAVALRNVLVHEYQWIDLARIWQIIQDDIHPLLAELNAHLRTIS